MKVTFPEAAPAATAILQSTDIWSPGPDFFVQARSFHYRHRALSCVAA